MDHWPKDKTVSQTVRLIPDMLPQSPPPKKKTLTLKKMDDRETFEELSKLCCRDKTSNWFLLPRDLVVLGLNPKPRRCFLLGTHTSFLQIFLS